MSAGFQCSGFGSGFQRDCGEVPVVPVGRGGRYRRHGVPVFDYGQDNATTKLEREYELIGIFEQPAATWSASLSVTRSREWLDTEALVLLGAL